MDLIGIAFGNVDWIQLAENRFQWSTFMNIIMNFPVTEKREDLSISQVTVHLAINTLALKMEATYSPKCWYAPTRLRGVTTQQITARTLTALQT